MTRLGFYIIHNLKYSMVCSVDVPWNFETESEDDLNAPDTELNIGEPEEEEEENTGGEPSTIVEGEPSSEPEPEEEKETFAEWFVRYYDLVLSKDSKFMNRFNNYRTYVIISYEKEDVMGLFNISKGWTYINFDEFDYRVIINELFPDIRSLMDIPDEDFGGNDSAGDNNVVDDIPNLIDGEVTNHKTLATYPNLIYHLCIGHFDREHIHKNS